jgi:hypothetical protein
LELKILLLLLSIFTGVASFVAAEDVKSLSNWSNVEKIKQGVQIRVLTVRGDVLEGKMGDVVGDLLSIIKKNQAVRLRRDDVSEVAKQKDGSRIVSSAIYGTLIGVGAAYLATLSDDSGHRTRHFTIVVLLGAGAGAAVGASFTPRIKYQTIYKAAR